jgi:hypothetical protein
VPHVAVSGSYEALEEVILWRAGGDVGATIEVGVVPVGPRRIIPLPGLLHAPDICYRIDLSMARFQACCRDSYWSTSAHPARSNQLPRPDFSSVATRHAQGAVTVDREVLDHSVSWRDCGHRPPSARLPEDPSTPTSFPFWSKSVSHLVSFL